MNSKDNVRAQPIQGSIYALLIGGNLWLTAWLSDVPMLPPYDMLLMVSVMLGYLLFRRINITASWRPGQPGSLGTKVLASWGWLVGLVMFLALITKSSETFSRQLLILWFLTTPVLLVLAHLVARYLLVELMPRSDEPRTAVIIFANDSARMLGSKLMKSTGYKLLGYFDDREDDRTGGGIADVPLLGKARVAAQYVRDHEVEVVFVVLPDSGARRAIAVIDELGDTTASLYYVPDFFMFSLLKAQVGEIESVPVLQVAESPFYGVDGVLKQIFDFVFAFFALIAILPILGGVAIAVKMSSPGPVFFKQKRYGLNGKRFWVYKFRSMKLDAPDAGTRQATKDDDRITRVGRFIRKTSLDELPQFINVLKGEMSVVGPRPHTVAHNEHYRKQVTRYMLRHKVKPGVTGWAQVNGLRGETANIERMEERIRFDLEYIRNWSPWHDLKIIWLTVWMMVRGDENAY
ncbi:MAG: undecaprenyl-phosphate glucose phosphotransferase [Pseudomonadota bacterium]